MFSDDELKRYLEGTADTALRDRIEAALQQSPALEDRLMSLDKLAPIVRDAMELLPSPQLTGLDLGGDDQPRQNADKPAWHGWKMMAAGFVLGAIFAGAVAWQSRQVDSDWHMAVASYQALYASETIATLDFSPAELRGQMSAAETLIGTQGLFDVVSHIDGLELLRIQILAFDHQPLVQMVFATDNGVPVALCVMAGSNDTAKPDTSVKYREGLASFSFETGNHRWLLIGSQSEQLIGQAAQQLQTRLTAHS